jgi:CheY-like chemotaxis protein
MKKEREARPKILVIDDEPDFLRVLSLWLREEYDATCLSSGAELSEQLLALEPDLVLLDAHMPDADGFEICRRLRAQPGGEDLPIVFLTGSRADEDFLRHIQAGGSRFLMKPIARRELLAAVKEELGLGSLRF